MSTPAKDRFMHHIHETINALEFTCLQLSQDIRKFGTFHLTHSMSIMTGMAQNMRKYLIVNHIELKQKLPKGVLKHGTKRPKKGKQGKGSKR